MFFFSTVEFGPFQVTELELVNRIAILTCISYVDAVKARNISDFDYFYLRNMGQYRNSVGQFGIQRE